MQVVSDIDDTLMCSGGTWPAGRDTRYPKKCMYPGALTFYSELDIGYNTKIQVNTPSVVQPLTINTDALQLMLRLSPYNANFVSPQRSVLGSCVHVSPCQHMIACCLLGYQCGNKLAEFGDVFQAVTWSESCCQNMCYNDSTDSNYVNTYSLH